MRTGRSELHPRVVQLLEDVSFDDKDGTLLLGKHKHHPNTTAKYLSLAKICSLCINGISFRYYVGDTSFLSDLFTLSKLVIEHCNLSGNEIKCIAEGFLVHCKGIDSKASDEEARSLIDVEGGSGAESSGTVNTTLEHVDLRWCRIGPLEAQRLAQALCVNTSVKTLDLSGNPLCDVGARALAEMLGGKSSGTVNTTLEHVNLSYCSVRPVGAQHLAQALCVNTSVKTLDLSNNPLGDEAAKVLAEMLGGKSSGTVNTTLEHVNLSYCSIGPVGAQHLAQALCVNTSVKTLDLSRNPLGDEAAKVLAEMLGGKSSGTVNTTLEHVNLSYCSIGPVGAQHLAQALCVNTSVKTEISHQGHISLLNWRDMENLTEQQKERIAHRCL